MSSLAEETVQNAVAIGIALPRFEHLDAGAIELRPDASARYVYCSGIEAWTAAELRSTLATIMRILEPAGILRIAAQDLDTIIHGYLLEWSKDQATQMSRAQRLNAWRKSETAEFVFNEEELRTELENAGFVDIWRLAAGASSLEVFVDCERSGSTELVFEGRKPVLAE